MDEVRHSWDLTPKAAIQLQRQLAHKVSEVPLEKEVRRVVGIDCSYIKSRDLIVTAVVVLDAKNMRLLETARKVSGCTFPYVPGLLSFREAPAVIETIEELVSAPDLLLCDGQGLAHPRGMGLATHIGLWLNLPTIGVAKSRLCGEFRMPGARRGCNTRLLLGNKVIGRVVRTRTGVKPLFVSVGHRITLQESLRWTLKCTRGYRLPEPTRLAHHEVTKLRKAVIGRAPGKSKK